MQIFITDVHCTDIHMRKNYTCTHMLVQMYVHLRAVVPCVSTGACVRKCVGCARMPVCSELASMDGECTCKTCLAFKPGTLLKSASLIYLVPLVHLLRTVCASSSSFCVCVYGILGATYSADLHVCFC